MISFDKLLLLTFLAVSLILVAESRGQILLEDDGNALDRLLNYINKPPIKSFQVN